MEPATLPVDLLIREQSDLAILEAPSGGGIFNPDGTVNMVAIRPCNGRGPYQNIYEAEQLARDAGILKGLAMFDNHDSPLARKARAGLPRPPSELGGVIRESWWDPEFTTPEDAKMGFGKGGVIVKCALTDAMEALARKVPEALKGSLNMQATNKRLGERNGARGWIVEGFVDDPENSSFDLVTKAGAGGRVRSVLEALYDGSNATEGLTAALESVSDDDLVAFLREHRPDVLSGGPMNLQEALQSDEVKGFLGTMIADGIKAGIEEALPTALAERENNIRESLREDLGQAGRLRTLAGDAKTIIETAVLPQSAKNKLLDDYGVVEHDDETVTAGPSLALIEAEIDGDGKIVKPIREVLRDKVGEDVQAYRTIVSEAAPTIPRAPTSAQAGTAGGVATFGGEGSRWGDRLRRRGVDPSQFGAPKPATTTE